MGQCCLAHRISCPGRFLDGHHPGRQTAVSIKESGRQLPVYRLVIPVLLRTASPPYHAPSFPSSSTPHSPLQNQSLGSSHRWNHHPRGLKHFSLFRSSLRGRAIPLLAQESRVLVTRCLEGLTHRWFSNTVPFPRLHHITTSRRLVATPWAGETIWIGCGGRGGIDGWRWSDIDHLRTPIPRWKSVVLTSST